MVRYVSDDVGVMYLGQLVEVCEAGEIYKNPLHPYTKGLLGSIPIANPKLAKMKEKSSIEGDIPSPIKPPYQMSLCETGLQRGGPADERRGERPYGGLSSVLTGGEAAPHQQVFRRRGNI